MVHVDRILVNERWTGTLGYTPGISKSRHLGPAVVVVLTLALSLAANTAAFAVLKAFLLSELGAPDANRRHAISRVQAGANFLDG